MEWPEGTGAEGFPKHWSGARHLMRMALGRKFSSVVQSCPTLCKPMDCSMPDHPIHSPVPGTCSNSCPSSRWCHPNISSSVIPVSSCLQSFPASVWNTKPSLFLGASAWAAQKDHVHIKLCPDSPGKEDLSQWYPLCSLKFPSTSNCFHPYAQPFHHAPSPPCLNQNLTFLKKKY